MTYNITQKPCRPFEFWFLLSRLPLSSPIISFRSFVVVPCRNVTDVINPRVPLLRDPKLLLRLALIVGAIAIPVDSRKPVDTMNLSMLFHKLPCGVRQGCSTRNLQAGQEITNVNTGRSQTKTFDMTFSGRAGNRISYARTLQAGQETTHVNIGRNFQAGQEITNVNVGQNQTRTFDTKFSGRARNRQEESVTHEIFRQGKKPLM